MQKNSFLLIILLIMISFMASCGEEGEEDLCENVICQNEGTCNEGKCECKTGFEGENCETNIDDCIDNTCLNNGICIDGLNSYSCQCEMGFEGDNCETNIDDCKNKPCLNGGVCSDGVDSYTCECVTGFEGDNCEINIDDCIDSPCQNGGVCIDRINSHSCDCTGTGFGGDNCEVDLTAFITVWKTDNEGVSDDNQVEIPVASGTIYNYNVDCNNDGINEFENQTESVTCTYQNTGTYIIKISGDFPRLYLGQWGSDARKLIDVKQ